jgi:predicted metal-dependent hydrolase
MSYDPRYLAFFDCFNRQQYFKAHEVLEGLWLETRDDHRDFYKGLIQTAAVFLKLQQGKPDPAIRLAQRARTLLPRYGPRCKGLDVTAILQRLDAVLAGQMPAATLELPCD